MGLSEEHLTKLVQAAAEATFSCFTRKSGSASALELTKVVNFQIEAAFSRARQSHADIPCQAGCKYCCHLRVAAFPYEAAAISSYLATDLPPTLAEELTQRVKEKAAQIANLDEEQHLTTNIECAFLFDGKCVIYPVRPSACAGYHSMSQSQCEYSYNHPTDLETVTPYQEELKQFHAAIDEGIKQALILLKLDSEKAELHTALAAAMA